MCSPVTRTAGRSIGLTHELKRLETELVYGSYQLGTTVIVTTGIGYSIVLIRCAVPGSIELIDLRVCGPPRG